ELALPGGVGEAPQRRGAEQRGEAIHLPRPDHHRAFAQVRRRIVKQLAEVGDDLAQRPAGGEDAHARKPLQWDTLVAIVRHSRRRAKGNDRWRWNATSPPAAAASSRCWRTSCAPWALPTCAPAAAASTSPATAPCCTRRTSGCAPPCASCGRSSKPTSN